MDFTGACAQEKTMFPRHRLAPPFMVEARNCRRFISESSFQKKGRSLDVAKLSSELHRVKLEKFERSNPMSGQQPMIFHWQKGLQLTDMVRKS